MTERRVLDELPDWPEGTPAVLCTHGPHAIPVSTAVRAGPRRIVLALAVRRESLERLRAEPRVAFCVLAADLAFTAYGSAEVVREQLDGARWHFTTDEALDDSRRIAAELRELVW